MTAGDPVVRVVDVFVEAFRPIIDQFRQAWHQLPPLEPFMALADAVERGKVALEPDSPSSGCHCLCGMHGADGMFCTGTAVGTVPLSGPLGLTPVPMCFPCGHWWLTRPRQRTLAR